MRKVAVVTVSRSDYGILTPVMKEISSHDDLQMAVIAAGMHLAQEHGLTVRDVEKDGWPVAARVAMTPLSDTGAGMALAIGAGVTGFANALARCSPDILVLLGDRFETLAAAVGAAPQKIPIAHIHGGEATFGALDDAFRHAISKLSHLHFTSTHQYGERLKQMGEEDWRIIVSGAPGLDNLRRLELPGRDGLEALLGRTLLPPPLLVTFHPETVGDVDLKQQMDALLSALKAVDMPVIFTAPNADTGGRYIAARIQEFVQGYKTASLVANLGSQAYFGLMEHACAMVGNSSSGLIEAPSFELPVVNIGCRQEGRLRTFNVVDVPIAASDIAEAIRRVTSAEFASKMAGMSNPYGDGHAARIITERLASVPLDNRLLMKRFVDRTVDSTRR